MASTLFVRIRGRVLGPFDQEKLRSLAGRGQFGRMHEVSEDGVSWARASLYPELFRADDGRTATSMPQAEATVDTGIGVAPPAATVDMPAAVPPSPLWFYELGGNQTGPVNFGQLRALAAKGELRPTDRVWTQSMAQWAPARDVEGLLPSSRAADDDDGARMGDEVLSQLADTRPWMIMFAVIVTLSAVGLMISGVFLLILAAKSDIRPLSNLLAGQSIASFISGAIHGLTSFYLFTYLARLRDFSYHRDQRTLAATLQVFKRLVVFWGAITAIAIVFAIVGAVYSLAVI